jgi:hypothetical protein
MTLLSMLHEWRTESMSLIYSMIEFNFAIAYLIGCVPLDI